MPKTYRFYSEVTHSESLCALRYNKSISLCFDSDGDENAPSVRVNATDARAFAAALVAMADEIEGEGKDNE
jgi:hypothetical protein